MQIPPTNGWMVELGYSASDEDFTAGYRIYISGDTLVYDDIREIPKLGRNAVNSNEVFIRDLVVSDADAAANTVAEDAAVGHEPRNHDGDHGRDAGAGTDAAPPARHHNPDPLRRL